jgi:hypothetical protein
MNPLARESVALLDAARDGDDPQPGDRARMRRRLLQVGVGAAVATTGTAAAGSALAKAVTSGVGPAVGTAAGASIAPAAVGAGVAGAYSLGLLAAKVVGTLAIVGGIGVAGAKGVAVYESRHGAATRTSVVAPTVQANAGTVQTSTASEHERAEPTAPVVAETPPTPAAIAPAPVTDTSPPRAVVDGPRPTSNARHEPVGTRSAPAPHAIASTLEAETRLLRAADVALRSGDAQRALALLDEHAARFPAGVLEEERAAERVLALCSLGRTHEAQADVERFLRERPRSPLADRVRSSCATGAGR